MRFTALLTDDPRLRPLLVRQLMAHASYLMFALPLLMAVHWEWSGLTARGVLALAIATEAANVVVFVLIRSGWSARFRDRSLLLPQMLLAIAAALFVIHFTREARSLMLMLFVALQFFGLFGLGKGQFWIVTAASTLGYAGLMAYEFAGQPLDTPAFRMELLRLLMVAMISTWMSAVGGHVAGMRHALAERRKELSTALEQVRELSERDELTGVHNRRHLMTVLERERARAERFGLPFSLAIVDLDHFKRINDEHGHGAGDDVLRHFAAVSRGQARELDAVARLEQGDARAQCATFGRFGGEEFLLALPHTNSAGAVACVERLRRTLRAAPVSTRAGDVRVTFSAGVAEYRPGESIAALLQRADEALYVAKDGGRDRTATAD